MIYSSYWLECWLKRPRPDPIKKFQRKIEIFAEIQPIRSVTWPFLAFLISQFQRSLKFYSEIFIESDPGIYEGPMSGYEFWRQNRCQVKYYHRLFRELVSISETDKIRE